eukprot:TRINITY_DN29452_c0_g1_i1.p1 TRINITY_DN29452_c0_g1~~TRINITY_DN29452_c0_g1_i1.p1  ORF type:complete len:478 (-),score=60.79 TRINITY_DN29452_c0_g1_i1:309-1640(-)
MAVDPASTAFMFLCMTLVQLMTPGLALFYGGLVRESSVITMIMQNFSTMGIVTMMWYFFLYSLCFGESLGFVGNPLDYAWFRNVTTAAGPIATEIPHLLFAGYQGMFAVITPALMTGCFADRFCYGPFLIFIIVWMVVIYAPCCHWIWGGGWMAKLGVYDFAGGIVVHITAGFSALGTLLVVGRRQVPKGGTAEDLDQPSNRPMVVLGTALLWFGWFGFNGGSALSCNGVALVAAINSQIAAAAGCVVWMCLDWATKCKPSLVGKCVGAIAGLATVTPAAGFVQAWAAAVLGGVASVFCYGCCEWTKRVGLDDALDVWGVHGMGGFLGTVLLGVLADPPVCGDVKTAPDWCVNPGTATRSFEFFVTQLLAAIFVAAYSFIVTIAFLSILVKVMRVSPTEGELEHLDSALHGEVASGPNLVKVIHALTDEESEDSDSTFDGDIA